MTDAAAGSPLARLRSAYASRQHVTDLYADVWDDGELVAKLKPIGEERAARGAMLALASLSEGGAEVEVAADGLADVVEAATASLHARTGPDAYEALLDADGQPLRFDAAFGLAIGVPGITTPRAAVFAAFSRPAVEGGPAELDVLWLLTCATAIAAQLVGADAGNRARAESVVGEASAPTT